MRDACVIGDSLPAFAAALELAEVGLSVQVVLLGGRGGWPATAVRDPERALAGLLDRVAAPIAGGSADPDVLPRSIAPRRVLMPDARGGWSPVPEPSVFGIPAVPASSETLAFVRGGAAVRAYLDRVKPLLTIGKTHELGRLVQLRMGEAVRERLVEPFVRERFGTGEAEVAVAAPGLNEALTLAGSLSGAVLAYANRHVARETRVVPHGGWEALRSALIRRLELYGVEFVEAPAGRETASGVRSPDGPADELQVHASDGSWLVHQGAAVCEARSLVFDTGIALPEQLAETIEALTPRQRRTRAIVPVVEQVGTSDLSSAGSMSADGTGSVAGAESGAVAAVLEAEAASAGGHAGADAEPAAASAAPDALQLVAGSEAVWSVRVGRDDDGVLRARLAGPAHEAREAHSATPEEIAEMLSRAGLTPAAEPRVELRPAPYSSAAEREADRARLAGEREAEPNLLAVGCELHGDDVAAAVADAVAATVGLRRRLTGIAD